MQVIICPYCRHTDMDDGLSLKRNKWVALILSLLLGLLGAHRFYMGHRREGMFIFFLSISLIGLLITVPWVICDSLHLLLISNKTFKEYACHC